MGRTHPNVLKVSKQKRMRRAYLKPYFGEIRVPRRVGKADVPEDMQSMFDYRKRGNTYWDIVVDRIAPTMLSKKRLEVLETLERLTAEVVPECNVVVYRGGITKTIIRFYFAPDLHHCFFMKEDWRGLVMYKSSPYTGEGARDRAYFDYGKNRLTWIERIPLQDEGSPPSS